MASGTPPLLCPEGISKSFGGVPVLSGVTLDVLHGEVHALIGENGAGKSTLMNIVGGVLQPDAGRMEWTGTPVEVRHPRAAQDLGISFVHQELALVPHLSIAENVFLGRDPSRHIGLPVVKWGDMRDRAHAILAELGDEMSARPLHGQLGIAERQLVEL